jgi:opacity protein-like surface antigen
VARLLLLLVTAAVALVSAAQAATPVVPVATQARIAKVRPALAYAPTRMLIGFRFRSWRTGPAAVY